eukprot:jgi/Hompol1/4530/HPOL_000943-RA
MALTSCLSDLVRRLCCKGSFGSVYKGIKIANGEVVAIKVLDLDTDEDEITDVRKEIALLSTCDSPFVTRYHGSILNNTKLWIVMDYAGGGSVRRIVAANILLTDEGLVRLCDFGVAGKITMTSKRNSFVGTPYWMAPEIIKRAQYDAKADIWSLGITIIELATGNPPFADQDPRRALFLIPRSRPPKLEGRFSSIIQEFIANCLREEPEDRPTAEQLQKFKFIKEEYRKVQVLKELLVRHERWKAENGDPDEDLPFSSV